MTAIFIVVRRGRTRLVISRRELIGCAVMGLLLPVGGNGLVTVAEQQVESATTALIIASVPIWVAVFRLGRGDRLPGATVVGTAIGFVGLVVLLRADWGGVLSAGPGLVALASACWAFGSFLHGSLELPADTAVTATYEMLLGGVVLVAAGAVNGEELEPSMLTAGGWLSWGYLVMFGSVLAFACYSWLLENAPLSVVSTYAYVNPLVALALGVIILDESLAPGVLIGGAVTIAGVVMIVRTERGGPADQAAAAPDVGVAVRDDA